MATENYSTAQAWAVVRNDEKLQTFYLFAHGPERPKFINYHAFGKSPATTIDYTAAPACANVRDNVKLRAFDRPKAPGWDDFKILTSDHTSTGPGRHAIQRHIARF